MNLYYYCTAQFNKNQISSFEAVTWRYASEGQIVSGSRRAKFSKEHNQLSHWVSTFSESFIKWFRIFRVSQYF